jgi:hypothetical protein
MVVAEVVDTFTDVAASLPASSVDESVSYLDSREDDEDESVALRNHAAVAPRTIMRTSRRLQEEFNLPADARPEPLEVTRTMVVVR